MNKEIVLEAVGNYNPLNNTDAAFQRQILDFLQRCDEFWQRSTLEGHITGSAWICSPDFQRTLLIHHIKLDRWLQPGGHVEGTDAEPGETAEREAREECFLTVLNRRQTGIFDLDVHPIPAKNGVPEHLHYDLRYLFVTPEILHEFDALEVKGMQWVPIRDLCGDDTPESLRRMALRTLAL